MNVLVTRLKSLAEQCALLMKRLGIEEREKQAMQWEKLAAAPNFWEDTETAQNIMQKLSRVRATIEHWQSLSQRINETLEMAELLDESLFEDLTAEAEDLENVIERMTLRAMLGGEYDSEDAILAIHAGAGGTDSQDWCEIMERMYLRWAEYQGYRCEILERSEGENAGIKSVTISVGGEYAYGYLLSEQGVHRLVRVSPFDAANRRHTSFAKVELWPDIQDEINIEILPRDLRIDTYRAAGAGGQHVQKNDTAVRITHEPTGIVVQCQNQRSQSQNRQRAMQILKSRLYELERQRQREELAELKGENVGAAWGNQIRSYVLHPYQMVKDHRTNHETGNVQAVLDGRLDEFMESYLRSKIGNI